MNLEHKKNIFAILNAIQKHQNIFIFHHIRPDGDCLGAQFGLKELIELNYPNKKVFVIGNANHLFPFLNFQHDDFEKIASNYFENSLAILVDSAESKRVESAQFLQGNYYNQKVRIDHHDIKDDFNFDALWVDGSYAACCEQILELAKKSNWKISYKAAEYLYLGINTDSGRFNYENIKARTFYLVGWMCEEAKFDPFKINFELSKRSEKYIRFQAEVINNFQRKNKLCWAIISQELMQKHNMSETEANDVNILANIEDSRAWVFFIAIDSTHYRVRLRSNSINVNKIAQKFNGGGHNLAAGATIEQKQLNELLNALWHAIESYELSNPK